MAKPFTVVAPVPTSQGLRTLPSSRERHHFDQVNPSDLEEGNDLRSLARTIKFVQDNAADATLPYRTNPLLHGELHKSLATTSGQNLTIKHSLGEQFGGWKCTRAYAGSAAFSAVEAANNGGQDPKKYLVLAMGSTGTYDIEINPT